MKILIILTSLLTCGLAWSHGPESLEDAAVITLDEDSGDYRVHCKDGNVEVATDLDIKLDNVCPKLLETGALGVLSLQTRKDGRYDVVCTDFTKHIATKREVAEGTVCAGPLPPPTPGVGFDLQEGVYITDSSDGFFCPEYSVSEKVVGTDGSLEGFKYSCPPESDSWVFVCDDGYCKEPDRRVIKIRSGLNAEFTYQTSGRTTLMTLRANL